MSYYTGRGDYYSGKGDPGILSSIGSVFSVAGKVLPGPLGTAASGIGKVLGRSTSTATSQIAASRAAISRVSSVPRLPAIPQPGIGGAVARFLPGGSSGYVAGGSPCGTGYHLDKTHATKCVRNRRTNYANPAALARAARRLDGFVGVARKAMKSTNYKVVSKSYKQNWRKPTKR